MSAVGPWNYWGWVGEMGLPPVCEHWGWSVAPVFVRIPSEVTHPQHSCHPSLEKVEESIPVLKVEESTHHTDTCQYFHKGIFVLTKCGPKVFLQLPCSRSGVSSTTKCSGMELRMTQKLRKTQRIIPASVGVDGKAPVLLRSGGIFPLGLAPPPAPCTILRPFG